MEADTASATCDAPCVAGEFLEEIQAGSQEFLHVILTGAMLDVSRASSGNGVFPPSAAKEHTHGTWLSDEELLANELPCRRDCTPWTRHVEVINIHDKKNTGS